MVIIITRKKTSILSKGMDPDLENVIEEGMNHMRTVSMLQLHQHAIIACDEEATMELRLGTVKYFRHIESHTLKNLHDGRNECICKKHDESAGRSLN
jgi:hypothetical protein